MSRARPLAREDTSRPRPFAREGMNGPRPFARKGETSPEGGAAPTPETTAKDRDDDARAVVCLACGHAITRTDAAISAAGAHTHTFMNPGGHVFEIACYRDAPGARDIGPPSSEWSWFPGATWRVTVCAACRAHLGWRFQGEEYSHYGLIRDRLGEA